MITRLRQLPRNTQLALLITVGAILWLLTGVFSGSEKPQDETAATPLPNVTLSEIAPQPYTRVVTLVGRSEADVTVHLAAQTAGSVAAIPVQKGDYVTAGTALLKINLNTRMEDLKAAKANLAAERVQVESARKLHTEGFASDTTLAQREAAVANAEQALARIERDIAYTTVQAPLAGIIETKHVEVGDYVQIGTALFELVGQEKFLITGFAAQQDRNLIQVGQSATAKLVNGQEVTGTIRFVATQAEATTRTYRVEMQVDGSQYTIPTGMTATLMIPTQQQLAYSLPHSVLVLADDGTLGVMQAINGKAKFQQVTLLQDTADGVWVEGLPENGVTLITRGQAAVQDGTLLTQQESTD